MKLFVKILLITVALIALYTGGMYATFSIPDEAVAPNGLASIEQIHRGGTYHRVLSIEAPASLNMLDRWTDSVMMLISISARPGYPMESALMDALVVIPPEEIVANLGNLEAYDSWPKWQYARYWHGYLTIVRPALTVVDYSTIILVNEVLMYALMLFTIAVVWRRLGRFAALSLGAVLLLCGAVIVPMCLQFSTCFYIALGGMSLILLFPRLTATTSALAVTMYVIGSVTAFFDFLTTPMLVAGWCTIAALLLRRDCDGRTLLRLMGVALAMWFAGYAVTWSSKWLIAQLLVDYNVLGDAIDQMQVRLATGMDRVTDASKASFTAHFLLVQGLLTVGLLAYAWIRRRRLGTRYLWLLVVAVMPSLWYLVMLNHTLNHLYFVWRSSFVIYWAVALYLWYTLRRRRRREPAV